MNTATHTALVVLHAPERGESKGWFATCNQGDCNGGWWPTHEVAQQMAEMLVAGDESHIVRGED